MEMRYFWIVDQVKTDISMYCGIQDSKIWQIIFQNTFLQNITYAYDQFISTVQTHPITYNAPQVLVLCKDVLELDQVGTTIELPFCT